MSKGDCIGKKFGRLTIYSRLKRGWSIKDAILTKLK